MKNESFHINFGDDFVLVTENKIVRVCELCKRELGEKFSTHHLVPVLKGGRNGDTVKLHKICHDKIHSLFSERELQVKYNTIEKLLTNDKIISFVKWVQNKQIDFYDGSKKYKQ